MPSKATNVNGSIGWASSAGGASGGGITNFLTSLSPRAIPPGTPTSSIGASTAAPRNSAHSRASGNRLRIVSSGNSYFTSSPLSLSIHITPRPSGPASSIRQHFFPRNSESESCLGVQSRVSRAIGFSSASSTNCGSSTPSCPCMALSSISSDCSSARSIFSGHSSTSTCPGSDWTIARSNVPSATLIVSSTCTRSLLGRASATENGSERNWSSGAPSTKKSQLAGVLVGLGRAGSARPGRPDARAGWASAALMLAVRRRRLSAAGGQQRGECGQRVRERTSRSAKRFIGSFLARNDGRLGVRRGGRAVGSRRGRGLFATSAGA